MDTSHTDVKKNKAPSGFCTILEFSQYYGISIRNMSDKVHEIFPDKKDEKRLTPKQSRIIIELYGEI